MPSQSDAREIEKGKVSRKRRFDKRDFNAIADMVIDTWSARKRRRSQLERQWKEIDRQLAMEPDIAFKKDGRGQVDTRKVWMSELELSLQAQALEVLTADARRLMFGESWFRGHAAVDDKYLREAEAMPVLLDTDTDLPSNIAQENADRFVESFVSHLLDQGDFRTVIDKINAEAFKYGIGIGRVRMQTKRAFIHTAKGVVKETQEIPVVVPMGPKNVYLDDSPVNLLTSAPLSESHIIESWIRLESLQLAANAGSRDPNDNDGGWMPGSVANLEPDRNGFVHILEMEGDIVLPRKSVRSLVLPGAIVTVAVGGRGANNTETRAVVRFRWRKQPFSSYILFPYHYESATDIYPASPLMKGRPLQIAAVSAMNRLLDSAALKNAPPVGYNRDDQYFAQEGGPIIEPYAKWQTTDEVKVYSAIGGDPGTLAGFVTLAINLYAELTGVLPSRLGAQTVSHTTAFAKDAEIQRGAARTVDYVNQVGEGAITRLLWMIYTMGRESLPGNRQIVLFSKSSDGFIRLGRPQLPEKVVFDWLGSGGPTEEARRMQAKLTSLQLAIQMDQLNVQLGGQPSIDIPEAQRQVLREGNWSDVDAIIRTDKAIIGRDSAASALSATAQGSPGPTVAALQALRSIGSGTG